MRLSNILFQLLVVIVAVLGYHFFLVQSGYLSKEHIKGVYTIDLTHEMQRIAREAREAINRGETVDIRGRLEVLRKQIHVLVERLPEGYLLLPEETIIGGKRKLIDLSSGRVVEKKAEGKALRFDLLREINR